MGGPAGLLETFAASLVGNVKTPTLVVVGAEDYRTPVSEAEQYYDALQLRGVPTALGEGARAPAMAGLPRGRRSQRPRRARSSPGSTAIARNRRQLPTPMPSGLPPPPLTKYRHCNRFGGRVTLGRVE